MSWNLSYVRLLEWIRSREYFSHRQTEIGAQGPLTSIPSWVGSSRNTGDVR